MDLEGLGFDLVVFLAFLFVGWYVVGAQWQRRTANAYVRMLGDTARALSRSGAAPRIRWFGGSGFQLIVDDAVDPFTKLSIVTMLRPRESVALWLVAVLRRRGDSIVVRADLRGRPRADETRPAAAPLGELSLSRESPHVIVSLDPGWVRANRADEIASALRGAASSS